MVYAFERVSDGQKVNVEVKGYYKSPRGNILSFDSGGRHYHLHAHQSSTNHFFSAKELASKGSTAVSGGTAGGFVGSAGGPVGTLVGIAAGSVLAVVGQMALESLVDHTGHMSYVDEYGTEAYWGPIAA